MDPKELRGLVEAYSAVYDEELRQDLEEQQAFENWVNSLVEEGYDLSGYTLEEMYEEYLNEMGQTKTTGQATAKPVSTKPVMTAFSAGGGKAKVQKLMKTGMSGVEANRRVSATGEYLQKQAAKPKPQLKGLSIGKGGFQINGKPAAKPAPAAAKPAPTPAAKPAPTPAAKPAPSAAKPAPSAPAAAKPAPTTPTASAEKPSAMDQWAKANPRLAQAQKIRQQGGSRAEVNKALYNKGTAAATSTPTVVKAGVDLFDIIQGYLLDEGFAETLQEAEWMMANLIDEEAIAIILGESAIGTMAVLGGMAAGRAIHGKLQGRKEKKEREAKRRTSDYLGMKSRTKNVVARDRRASGDTRNEEFELWVNELVEEGYDLSDYTWDEMYEFYLDEALTGERYKKVMKKPGGTAYSRKVSADPAKRATRGGKGGESDFGAGDRGAGNKAARRAGTYQEEYVDEASSRDEFTRAAIARNSGRKGGITFEPGPNWDPSANRGKGAHLSPKQKEKQRRKALRQEEYVDEAQHARENPEKYEREQAKKSAPVRGERTPMPPRGDKRREEFEKWYAKQMGR